MAFVNLLQAMYPVGSCYFSTVNTSPATVIGGTWAAMTGGMLGLAGSTGVASAANNGGSRKISTSQMPSHTHVPTRTLNNGSPSTDLGWWASNASAGNEWLLYSGQTSGARGIQSNSYTGGVRIIFPHTPLSTVGEELLNLLGGEQ